MLFSITLLQVLNVGLVLVLLFLGFKYAETNWSYKISKPFAWDAAVRQGKIPKKLKRLERFYRDKVRFYTLWLQLEQIKREGIAGAFAEVGVYQGETARIIHTIDPTRPLHLFDTFTGFHPDDLQAEKTDEAAQIDFSDTSVEEVGRFISGNKNVQFHPGFFPDTTRTLPEKTYAFVHLDADLYQPTLAALRYFYPRMSHGGTIIIHDYNHTWEGVHRAVTEFVSGIPEEITEIADWQGSVLIVRNKVV